MTTIMLPSGAGTATPEEGETLIRAESEQGLKRQSRNGGCESEEFGDAVHLARAKRLASIKAHHALAGFEMHELRSGAYLIKRAGFVRHATDIDAAATFLREVGVQV